MPIVLVIYVAALNVVVASFYYPMVLLYVAPLGNYCPFYFVLQLLLMLLPALENGRSRCDFFPGVHFPFRDPKNKT